MKFNNGCWSFLTGHVKVLNLWEGRRPFFLSPSSDNLVRQVCQLVNCTLLIHVCVDTKEKRHTHTHTLKTFPPILVLSYFSSSRETWLLRPWTCHPMLVIGCDQLLILGPLSLGKSKNKALFHLTVAETFSLEPCSNFSLTWFQVQVATCHDLSPSPFQEFWLLQRRPSLSLLSLLGLQVQRPSWNVKLFCSFHLLLLTFSIY